MALRRLRDGRDKCETTAFYAPPDCIEGDVLRFPEDELRHMTRVLRLAPPAVVEVLDGRGGCYQVELAAGGSGRLEGWLIAKSIQERSRPLLSVALALCRSERMKLAAEKLAELGLHRLVTLRTAHVDFSGSEKTLLGKLQRVAVGALKQSRSAWLMQVEAGGDIESLFAGAAPACCPVFCQMAGPRAGSSVVLDAGKLPPAEEYLLVVGPEGGFSRAEQNAIKKSGLPRLHLGASRLRAETAAIVGFTLLKQALRQDAGIY